MERTNKKVIGATIIMFCLIVGTIAFSFDYGHKVGINEGLDLNRHDTSGLTYVGQITVIKTSGNGDVLKTSFHNFITNAGLLAICDYIGGTSGNPFDYIAIGTGEGQTTSSTTLATEAFRAQGTFAEPVAYNWTITYTFPASTFDGENITEFGCFNAGTGGTMLNYQSDGGRVLTATDSLQVIIEFMVSTE